MIFLVHRYFWHPSKSLSVWFASFLLLTGVGFLLYVGGCSHYRLGTAAKLPFRTLYIAPVTNDTYIPQAQAPLTDALIQAFLRDGSVSTTAHPEEADAILETSLTDYKRSTSATSENDTFLARSFNVTLKAQCTLKDRRSGEDYFNRRSVSANTHVFFDSGFQSAEYQNVPKLTQELAREIRNTILSVW